MRGRKVGGLLRYLYGPGRSNEHGHPHLVACWNDDPAGLEPGVVPGGRHDVRRLAHLPEQPLPACRWVAVRHADDHIHLVVTLARPDGRRHGPATTSTASARPAAPASTGWA
jgi:hypothetical protein